ncbi:putative ATP-grasp-modified RiPP [Streptomyces sp. NPDC059568]|uniref:putative ATP-grasp-modified RiPP n=1 Tax=Streptomyces sp. NPDC059568 TaxID=3346868 RepID=UPI0036A190D1
MLTPLALQGIGGAQSPTAAATYSYDPTQQLNVTPSGDPFVAVSSFAGPTMTDSSGNGGTGPKKDDD